MSIAAKNPDTTPLPVQLSEPEFGLLPHPCEILLEEEIGESTKP
jgi:hypothetical protein